MSTVSSSTAVPAGTWAADPAHSNVGFAVKHMGLATVRGVFTEFAGTLEDRRGPLDRQGPGHGQGRVSGHQRASAR